MTICADKVTAPQYFKEHTGLDDKYIVKNIGIYDNENEVDFDSLPKRFVLKLNWGSWRQIIVMDKGTVDKKEIIKTISTWNNITANHYYNGFEY